METTLSNWQRPKIEQNNGQMVEEILKEHLPISNTKHLNSLKNMNQLKSRSLMEMVS